VVLSETLSQALSETLKSEKTRKKLEDRNVKARPWHQAVSIRIRVRYGSASRDRR